MVIRVAKRGSFGWLLVWLERGSLGLFLGLLKRGSFGSYHCG